jgi:hypothetical protein
MGTCSKVRHEASSRSTEEADLQEVLHGGSFDCRSEWSHNYDSVCASWLRRSLAKSTRSADGGGGIGTSSLPSNDQQFRVSDLAICPLQAGNAFVEFVMVWPLKGTFIHSFRNVCSSQSANTLHGAAIKVKRLETQALFILPVCATGRSARATRWSTKEAGTSLGLSPCQSRSRLEKVVRWAGSGFTKNPRSPAALGD